MKDYITFEVTHNCKNYKELKELILKYLFENHKRPKLPVDIESIIMIDNLIQIPIREYNDYKKCSKNMRLIKDDIDTHAFKKRKRKYNTKKQQMRDERARQEFQQQLKYGKILKCIYCGRANFKSLSGLRRHQNKCRDNRG